MKNRVQVGYRPSATGVCTKGVTTQLKPSVLQAWHVCGAAKGIGIRWLGITVWRLWFSRQERLRFSPGQTEAAGSPGPTLGMSQGSAPFDDLPDALLTCSATAEVAGDPFFLHCFSSALY